MFRISGFAQLLKGLSRGMFDRLVIEHASDKHCKGFSSYDHLVAMVYGQLSGAQSLRTLVTGFNSQKTHHYHLGTDRVSRSTLADANSHRSSEVFAAVAHALMAQAGRRVRSGLPLLKMLDSTTIHLAGRGLDDWAAAERTRCGQGLKVHVLWDEAGSVPQYQRITGTTVNDRNVAVDVPLEADVTYVFDKAYCDYQWWNRIGEAKALFVTRFKRNAALVTEQRRRIPKADRDVILSDDVVTLRHTHPRGGRPASPNLRLRRIEVAREGDDEPLVLATNDLTRPAAEIARCYRARWRIELFFKWIKQHLKVKTFLGRSENAVRIQLYCALITYLLLVLYRQAHAPGQNLWLLLSELSATLFQRPSLEAELYRRRRTCQAEMAARQGVLCV